MHRMFNLVIADNPFNVPLFFELVIQSKLRPNIVVLQVEHHNFSGVPLELSTRYISFNQFLLDDPIELPIKLHRVGFQTGQHIFPPRHDLIGDWIRFGLLKILLGAFKILPLHLDA